MAVQHLEQLHQDQRGLGLAVFVARECVDAAAEDLGSFALVQRQFLADADDERVYFGVLFIINNAIGLITPPVGVVLNVVCGVARIDMDSAIRGVWPSLIAETLALALLIVFPEIVTVPLAWLR